MRAQAQNYKIRQNRKMLISMLVKKKMGQKPFFVTLKQGSEVDKA